MLVKLIEIALINPYLVRGQPRKKYVEAIRDLEHFEVSKELAWAEQQTCEVKSCKVFSANFLKSLEKTYHLQKNICNNINNNKETNKFHQVI